MELPLVSIITPTFNSAKFILQTIQSVQLQSYKNWELIIVDDCSVDDSVKIIASAILKDNRIKFIQNQKNSGAGISRNNALKFANGRFVAFLDSDDLWKPEKLLKQVNYMLLNKVPFTFSFYDCIDENGNSLKRRIEAPKNLTYQKLFYCNFVGNLTGIYDTHFFGKIPISEIRKRQDWILWLTILKKIKVSKPIPESLAFYRVRNDSISSSKFSLIKSNYNVYRLFHQRSIIKSFWCMICFLFVQLLIKPRFVKSLQ